MRLKFLINFFCAFSLLFGMAKPLRAQKLTDVSVTGNVRVDTQTVLSYLKIKSGENLSAEAIDASLKALFATGLFADVLLDVKGSHLHVTVVENKILNQIVFEGNEKITDEVFSAEVGLRPREVFTPARVQKAKEKIQDIYRLRGRFSARVTPEIIQREQNRVDLIFRIEEGPVTAVRKIVFVGNNRFSDSRLESVILTKESRWYRFFTHDDTYDPDRLNYDKELLRQYYLSNGYADFRVLSAGAELSADQQDFYITFTLDEGPAYTFGGVNITSAVSGIDPNLFRSEILFASGDPFNNKEIEKTVQNIVQACGKKNFPFLDVTPKISRNPKNKTIDVTFEIVESSHVYVNKIIIEGNAGTDDEVIRREFRLAEGDPLNLSKLKRSVERIENLDFFNTVDVREETTNLPDRKDILVKVDEKSTGQVMFGGGYSTTDGPLVEVRMTERNFLGKGQEVRALGSLAKRTQEILLGFTEPYFLDYRGLSAGVDVYHLSTKQDTRGTFSSGGYRQKNTGATLRLGYNITEPLSQMWNYRGAHEKIDGISQNSSVFLKKMEGAWTISSLGHVLFYDKRDSPIDSTQGYYLSMGNEFSGIGGNVRYFKNTFAAGVYHAIDSDHTWILNLRGKYGFVCRVGKDIRLADRFSLGGQKFRGFAESGIGPRDSTTTDALGGQQFYIGTLETTFPLGLPKELEIRGIAFTDWGSLWRSGEVGTQIVSDKSHLRGSAGGGILWKSPFGMIGITFTKALKKVKPDRIEVFRINFGTEF